MSDISSSHNSSNLAEATSFSAPMSRRQPELRHRVPTRQPKPCPLKIQVLNQSRVHNGTRGHVKVQGEVTTWNVWNKTPKVCTMFLHGST